MGCDMVEVLDNKCPACGAKIEFNPLNQMWDCEYCYSKFTLEEMKAYKNASNDELKKTLMTIGSYVRTGQFNPRKLQEMLSGIAPKTLTDISAFFLKSTLVYAPELSVIFPTTYNSFGSCIFTRCCSPAYSAARRRR